MKNREIIAHCQHSGEGISVLVHWNSKLFPNLSGKSQVDRITTLITFGEKHLLGVPKYAAV